MPEEKAEQAAPEQGEQAEEAEEPERKAERTFTQEQLNAIVKERLARAKGEPPADYEEAKAKAAKAEEAEGRLDELAREVAKLKGENERMRHDADVAAWKQEAAEEVGVDASVLRGGTRQEVLDHAKQVKAAIEKATTFPKVEAGKPAGGRMGKAEVLAIEDPAARKRAILENLDEFYK